MFEIRAPAPTGATVAQMESDNGVYASFDGEKFGQTAYTHAGGIDQPIVMMRAGYNGSSTPISVHPHQNWRGSFELGSKSDGTLMTVTSGAPPIAWTGSRTTLDHEVARPQDGPIWFGNLIPGKSDGSDMQYMRNRYYDPGTGRFTQQDPIGLAGGMNLYGFAGGDAVNYSDPFGLCPPEDSNVQDCPSVQHWRDRAAASGSLFGRVGNSMMAGLAAVGEDAIASVQGHAVGGCGSEFACGVAPGGRGGFRNNRVLSNFKTGRHTVSVDAEIGGSGLGQVHVHLKGAGKVLIQSMDDLSGLPNKVAKNEKVQAALTKAFEWLSKVDK